MSKTTASETQTLALLRTLVTALEDKKAADLTVLHVGGISDITDYLVLATGNSEPHLRALRIEVEKVLDAAKLPIAGTEQGDYGSGWTVVDAFQIMVHVFTAEQRGNYALEKLWKDAQVVDLKTFEVAEPKAKRAAKPAAKVTKAKPTKAKPASKAKALAASKVEKKKTTAKKVPAVPGKAQAKKAPRAGKAKKV